MKQRKKERKPQKRKRPFGRLLTRLLYVISIAAILLGVYVGYHIHQRDYGSLPGKQALEKIEHAQATEIYTRYGTLMGRYYYENRNSISFDEIPAHIIHALVATEDARFYKHHGIDPRSLLRVFFKTILLGDEGSGGGSTITQQLAKNLYPRQGKGNIALLGSKIREMLIAWRLEDLYKKEKLIQLYLNTVPFGENTFGIKNASQLYFNKLPKKLTPEEGAVLVGMLKGTTRYNPHKHPEMARARRNVVLMQMARYGYLKPQEAEAMCKLPLATDYTPIDHNNGLAPYLREHLRPRLEKWCANHTKPNGEPYNLYSDGLKVYTTIDADLQRYAKTAVQKHLPWLQKQLDHEVKGQPDPTHRSLIRRNASRIPAYQDESIDDPRSRLHHKKKMEIFTWDGVKKVEMSPLDSIRHCLTLLHTGFVAMDPNNGNVLAWVGGIDHRFFKYDHVTSKRQVGSTFKPIVYANALKSGIGPCDYFPNDSIVYEQYEGWSPANADKAYGGVYSVKGALIHSINTVSVQVLMEGGIDSTIRLAGRMGLEGKFPRVPSLALGTMDNSVLNMAEAYSVFANRGVFRESGLLYQIRGPEGRKLETFRRDPPGKRILSRRVAEQITMMLQGVVDRGTARSLKKNFRFGGDIAGKTGTTQDQADGWFIGYNPNLVFAGWVGAEYPAIHFNRQDFGQGAAAALPIAGHFLHQLNQEHPGSRYLANFRYDAIDTTYFQCRDYREEAPGVLEKIFDLFKKDKKKKQKDKESNKNFFQRLINELKKNKKKDPK
jgi:penicillin-binding protein 1A